MAPLEIARFAFASLLPALLACGFFAYDQRAHMSERHPRAWQLVVGIAFGIASILGTELGVDIGDRATINVRDAAPVVAAFVFGGPAGIVAAVIGAVERWFAVLWGRGAFTRLACTIATLFAGLSAAFLRKHVFEGRRPQWVFGVMFAALTEVVHLSLVFVTNYHDVYTAFDVVFQCTLPMIASNCISVALAFVAVSFVAGDKILIPTEELEVAFVIQRDMLKTVVAALVLTVGFTVALQNSLAASMTYGLLDLGIRDLEDEIDSNARSMAEMLSQGVTEEVFSDKGVRHATLDELCELYGITEIHVVNVSGIILESTDSKLVNSNLWANDKAQEFQKLVNGSVTKLFLDLGPSPFEGHGERWYAGTAASSGFVLMGFSAEDMNAYLRYPAFSAAKAMRVGEGGFVIVQDSGGAIGFAEDDQSMQQEELIADVYPELVQAADQASGGVFVMDPDGAATDYEKCYVLAREKAGFTIYALRPIAESDYLRNVSALVSAFTEVLAFAALLTAVYLMMKRVVVKSITEVDDGLGKITDGDLDVTVDVRSSLEFSQLSDGINDTVTALKGYIDEAEARIDQELEYARTIQQSALPSVFPPYPNRTEFEIFASMRAAKEVGGDFYDFYLCDESHLVFLVADVSGKSIPGAMFMMRAKTVIKSYVDAGLRADDAFAMANNQLCEGNEANMFVTAWMGVIDLETGHVCAANAGHNPPAICRAGGDYELLVTKGGVVLGGMPGLFYRLIEFDLAPGDVLYLYTDGVTEANNTAHELFGEERLLASLNAHRGAAVDGLCAGVVADVDAYVGEEPQFDDMTMLALRYDGPSAVHEWQHAEGKKNAMVESVSMPAMVDNVEAVIEFVNGRLGALGFATKERMQIDVAMDEVLANVCNYAYGGDMGSLTVEIEALDDPAGVKLTFVDEGVAFNPLLVPEPNTKLSLEERKVGGYGIFIVRKTMDQVTYERKDGKNILTVVKYKG